MQREETAVSTASARTLDHPERTEIRLEAVLHALSDPMRLQVVRFLAELGEGEGAACSAIELAVSKSTTTHHFRVLREAGVISQVYRGTAKMNALRRSDLDALFPGLLDSVLDADTAQRRRTG
ncbi:helix-turn-helix transcriptional regulator [Planomonospora sp. ID67723]|uniref:ArsR/SmtB family transcription factor n=1 Tax=Planomonospora sp. ID67723 TaxID=2738134 RepID=UPI0018C356AE|nr:helix-turn-helix transcriptional regulator [Planomonospora sp. ID67723]MBG0827161.1 helix-turn-helix transcriptional regulator [Planomonospora sp. ID67723]